MTVTPPPLIPPTVPPPPKKGGCWKWGLIGCLGALVIGLIGIGVIVTIVFGAIKSTDFYKGARMTAEKDPRVIEALGAPVETGFWVSGNVNVSGNTGQADITIPLSGPKGKARLHGVGTRDSSGWHYSELTVKPEAGATIDLLTP